MSHAPTGTGAIAIRAVGTGAAGTRIGTSSGGTGTTVMGGDVATENHHLAADENRRLAVDVGWLRSHFVSHEGTRPVVSRSDPTTEHDLRESSLVESAHESVHESDRQSGSGGTGATGTARAGARRTWLAVGLVLVLGCRTAATRAGPSCRTVH